MIEDPAAVTTEADQFQINRESHPGILGEVPLVGQTFFILVCPTKDENVCPTKRGPPLQSSHITFGEVRLMVATNWPRKFVPGNLNPADFSELEPLYGALLERRLETSAQAETWLNDYSELASVVDEYGNRRYIDKSCHTDDPAIEKAFLHFVEEIEPKIKPLAFQLQKRFLESPAAGQLSGQRYGMLVRKWK